jgi:hypothetical protein
VSFWSAHRSTDPEVTVTVAGTTASAAWPVARAVAAPLGLRGGA